MTTIVQSTPASPLLAQLKAELDLGVAMSIDPANANLPSLALRVTTLNSPWFMKNCPVCHNQFREGDFVRLCPRCQTPYHDHPQFNLRCWSRKFADGQICTPGYHDPRFSAPAVAACHYVWDGALPDDAAASQDAAFSLSAESVNQFVAGLRASWPTFGGKEIYKVQPGDPMIDRICPWCRLRIRAGDWVVECPCGCGAYFHEDIFRHLTCWNEWNSVDGRDYCPNTGRPYHKQEPSP